MSTKNSHLTKIFPLVDIFLSSENFFGSHSVHCSAKNAKPVMGLKNLPMDSLPNFESFTFLKLKIGQTVKKLWLTTVNQKIPTQQKKIHLLNFFLSSEKFLGSHSMHCSATNARISYRSTEHANGFLAKFWVIYFFEVQRLDKQFKSFDCQPINSHLKKNSHQLKFFCQVRFFCFQLGAL